MNSVTTAELPSATLQPVKPQRSLAKRLLLAGVVIGALLGLGVYGQHWWTAGRFIEETDDAYVGGDVTVIGPRVGGYIAELLVTDNQLVHAGDLLARIDDRDYRVALLKTEGAVAAQQALLANLDATAQLQQALIAQARASIDATSAEMSRAQADHLRYQRLVKTSAVSVESAQRAEATFKTALAEHARAQATLLASQRQLDVIATQKQQARAALTQAQADHESAQLNLGYTELRAPVDGVIGNRKARVGAYAAAGAQLLVVVPARGLWVDANFKEDQLAEMLPGQTVSIRADVLPGREFHGHLGSLAPATGAQFSVLPAENATGNFTKIVQRVPVRIHLDEADAVLGQLRPGLSVIVEVDTHSRAVDQTAQARAL